MNSKNMFIAGFGVVLILLLGVIWVNRVNSTADAGLDENALADGVIFSEDPDGLNLSFWDDAQDAMLFYSLYLNQEMVNESMAVIPETGAVEETGFWDDRQDAVLFYSQYLKQEPGTGTEPDQLEPVDDLRDGRFFDQFYTAE
jgi:hypothetical protein